MWRFVFIFLLCAAAAPFLPGLLEQRIENAQAAQEPAEQVSNLSVERTHSIKADRHGHFTAHAKLNGRPVSLLVDTGASLIALPESIGRKIGIHVQPADFTLRANTANGVVEAAPVMIREIRIGRIKLKNIRGTIMKDRSLGTPLLGMTALSQLERFDITNGTLVLVQ